MYNLCSLYDFIGYPAGPILGKKVYEAFRIKFPNITPAKRVIKNKNYEGFVDLYPEEFLAEYFINNPNKELELPLELNK